MSNQARLAAVERGQTGIARKVLECVPIKEKWTLGQITSELGRIGSRPDSRIIGGCLAALEASGLIRESPRGEFCRVPIVKEETPMPSLVKSPVKEAAVPLPDPMSRLAAIAGRLRSMAGEIEDVALAIEERSGDADKELAKLNQLKTLLRDLG